MDQKIENSDVADIQEHEEGSDLGDLDPTELEKFAAWSKSGG